MRKKIGSLNQCHRITLSYTNPPDPQIRPEIRTSQGELCENGTCLIPPIRNNTDVTVELEIDTRTFFQTSKTPPQTINLELAVQPECRDQEGTSLQSSREFQIIYKKNEELLISEAVQDVEKSTAVEFYQLADLHR